MRLSPKYGAEMTLRQRLWQVNWSLVFLITVIGGVGDDVLTGSALSDEIFGGDGNDFVNGGFGHDRVNGGDDGDRFFHIGVADHGSDWIQDYDAAEGDVRWMDL